MHAKINSTADLLLQWYDEHRRELPWRAAPGMPSDPYEVWLSEIMLQQTMVVTVISYYRKFLTTWPNVYDLASASLDQVLVAWQGLGYYSRARNLHKCAQVVVTEHGGQFPNTENGLRSLPGIGPYTAAAIAAIAFGRKATPVDANIERIISRLYAISKPLPSSKIQIRSYAENLTPDQRAGDFAQALMDLGSIICRPRLTKCGSCPLDHACRASFEGDPRRYPIKPTKIKRLTRYGIVFWVEREDGTVLVRRRPEQGLLGGMMEFPSTVWRKLPWDDDAWHCFAPEEMSWTELADPVAHTFSHFKLELRVKVGKIVNGNRLGKQLWCHPKDFSHLALPTVMKKVVTIVEAFQAS